MQLTIHVVPDGPPEPVPAEGTAVHVEVRDTSLADAPATTLAAADGVTTGSPDWSADVPVDVPDGLPLDGSVTLWARVAASGSSATSEGDWITMQSFPLDTASGSATVSVRRVY
jgi:hypothetical protein